MHRVFALLMLTAIGVSPAGAFELDVTVPDEKLADDIRAVSLTGNLQEQDDKEEPTSSVEILSAAQADYRRVIGLMYDQGYFSPEINILVDGREAASIAPISAPDQISRIQISVDPGAKFTFGRASISPLSSQAELPEAFATGETARVAVLRSATAGQIEGWRQEGHAKAQVTDQEIIARHPQKKLDATVKIDPGPKLRFGDLYFDGKTIVPEERLREIAGWPSGTVFDPDTLKKVQTRMRRTGAFSTSNLTEAETPNPDGTLDVTATVNDALPRRYTFGAEYGTEEGLSVDATWMHRNIFGGAERLLLTGSVGGLAAGSGGIDYLASARLSRPATFHPDIDAYTLLEFEQTDEEFYDATTGRLEVGGVYYKSERTDFSAALALQTAKTTDDLGTRKYTIFSLPLRARFDRRDDPLDATKGYFASFGLEPFLNISGTENGVVSTADLRTYRKVGERIVLAVRGQFGSIAGPSLEEAPADYLFYSGGGGTVRGHRYESLGVELDNGDTIGGRSFLGVSGEVRVATGGNLSVVGFYDAGYIGAESFYDGSGEWQTGAGAGVRYKTGIGPIRFDVGVPVSGPGDPNNFEVYIGIGQSF